MKKGNWTRRKFFASIGLGVFGISLLKKSPLGIFTNHKKVLLKERIKINPSAVKRNNLNH